MGTIYEYKGVEYEMNETDPVKAKAKIGDHLKGQYCAARVASKHMLGIGLEVNPGRRHCRSRRTVVWLSMEVTRVAMR
jgi:hypothetical protein